VFSRFALKFRRERDRDTPVRGGLDSGYILVLRFGLCAIRDVVYFGLVIGCLEIYLRIIVYTVELVSYV